MSARDMLRDLIANTADDYLDARYGRDRDNDAVVELILGTRLREAADTLAAIDPIEFVIGAVDPIAELRRMALGDQQSTAPRIAGYDAAARPAEGSCSGIAMNGVHTQVFHCRQTIAPHPLHLWRTGLEWFTCQGRPPEPSTPAEDTPAEADHVHAYEPFGPHAGSRCLHCNQSEPAGDPYTATRGEPGGDN